MGESTVTKHLVTREEGKRLIKKVYVRGIHYGVRLGTFLVTEDNGDGTVRGFDSSGILTVSQADALKSVDALLSETLEGRGARLRISIHEGEIVGRLSRHVFIG